MTGVYPPGSAAGQAGREGAAGQALSTSPPPPAALCVGARTEIHVFSCYSPDQHARAVVGGCVVAALDGGAGWLVRLDREVPEFGGCLVEGPFWPPEGSCPNSLSARMAREAAA